MGKRAPKIFLLRRRYVALLAALALSAGIFYVAYYPTSVSAAASTRQLPIYSVERPGQKMCAISFDAAWGNEDTQTLIDILAKYNIHATFFVVGDWAEKYPESVKALHEAGHEVMSHSNHHDHYNSLTAEQIVADVTASNERIAAVTGVTPTLIRCPYGEYDDHVIAAIRSMGMEPIQWDVDSLDWKDYDAPTICKRVTSKLAPGSIVLFHNAALHTPEALPEILTCMIQEGYTVVPISQLILTGDYTIDHTGRQFSATVEQTPDSTQ
ncbi:MAG: polysaccharide deacetylase family protein [Clostridiales bacterium]|nr:polysaccharide deacetylase family protein [Candidatus Cacconaster stercorequi]